MKSVWIVLMGLLLVINTGAQDDTIDLSSLPGQIVIGLEVNRQYDKFLHLIDTVAGEHERLTSNEEITEIYPRISPDGNQIAYCHYEDNVNVHIMDLTTREVEELSGLPSCNGMLDWSPDGSQIVMSALQGLDEGSELYIVDVETQEVTKITDTDRWKDSPRWTPDGGSIVFIYSASQQNEVYILNVVDETLTRLTENEGFEYSVDVSSDGERILFCSDTDGDEELYVMNIDGSDVVQLTDNEEVADCAGVWSPDDEYILFYSNRANAYVFSPYVMRADGSGATELYDQFVGDFDWGISIYDTDD